MFRKRIIMLSLYVFILILMLFTRFFVQERYGYEKTHVIPESPVMPLTTP